MSTRLCPFKLEDLLNGGPTVDTLTTRWKSLRLKQRRQILLKILDPAPPRGDPERVAKSLAKRKVIKNMPLNLCRAEAQKLISNLSVFE